MTFTCNEIQSTAPAGRQLSCGTAGRLEKLATAAVGADAAETAAKTEIENKDAGGWGLE